LEKADVLFIYVATVVRYVGHRRFDPRKRLDQLLFGMGSYSQSASYRQLDVLYQGVLTNAVAMDHGVGEDESEVIQRLQIILATVVLVQQRPSIGCLAGLLEWSLHETEITLAQLSAVFIVPESEKENEDESVCVFHPSFSDFMLDNTRCTDVRLHIDARSHHTILAIRCLKLMNAMLDKASLLLQPSSTIHDRSPHTSCPKTYSLVTTSGHLPSYLRYATRYWISHVEQGDMDDDELISSLREFEQHHTSQWIECSRLLGTSGNVLSDLDGAIRNFNLVCGFFTAERLLNA
jgi:hypothetical protein